MHAQSRGFTVIELSITVGLLAVLSAMAIPAFNGYLERARTNRAISDIGRVSIELYRWRLNNGGQFPDTLAETNIDVPDDPWGQPYSYANVATASQSDLRKDRNLNPVNSDFDFYSNGPDGETRRAFSAEKARDDVVRANNGAFIGIAEDY